MRLIDADAANVDSIPCYYGSQCYIEDVEEWLKDQPTIDAVPVDKIQFTDLYLDGSEAIAVFKFGNQGITLRKKCEDVAPVVHGRWIPVPSSDMVTGKAHECSECKKMRFGSFKPKYCPNCGAKMDGSNDAENH